jgi:hypothetical protein
LNVYVGEAAGYMITDDVEHSLRLVKNQTVKKTPAEMMTRYSYKGKGKQNTNDNIRVSRLSQMNVVSEATNVLNVFPLKLWMK